jgi:hypothetical protein
MKSRVRTAASTLSRWSAPHEEWPPSKWGFVEPWMERLARQTSDVQHAAAALWLVAFGAVRVGAAQLVHFVRSCSQQNHRDSWMRLPYSALPSVVYGGCDADHAREDLPLGYVPLAGAGSTLQRGTALAGQLRSIQQWRCPPGLSMGIQALKKLTSPRSAPHSMRRHAACNLDNRAVCGTKCAPESVVL